MKKIESFCLWLDSLPPGFGVIIGFVVLFVTLFCFHGAEVIYLRVKKFRHRGQKEDR